MSCGGRLIPGIEPSGPIRMAVACATRRGCRFVEALAELVPEAELIVASFPEEPWEPRYFDDLKEITLLRRGRFLAGRKLEAMAPSELWSDADLLFVVSWRYLIPSEVYSRPRLGTFAFHDSLLPAYRGFSPTVWSILNGEDHTGATLFEIAEEMDAGDVVDQQRVAIGPDETIAEVLESVTDAYMELLARNLEALLRGTAVRRPQDHARATYACKRLPEDNRIDWRSPSARVYNLVRAAGAPYPGAYTFLDGRKLRVWAARRPVPEPRYVGAVPGRVVEVRRGEGTMVLTGDGALLLTRVQEEGGEVACAAEVLNSLSLTLGA
jgi:methionyl-tRNA formyltransferase